MPPAKLLLIDAIPIVITFCVVIKIELGEHKQLKVEAWQKDNTD